MDAVAKAEALLATGVAPTEEDKEAVATAAGKEWEAAYGSLDDPEVRDKVYKAAAALRKLEVEEAGRLAATREKIQQKKSRRRKLRGP